MKLFRWMVRLWLIIWRGIKLPAPFKESFRQEFVIKRRASWCKLIIGLTLAALFGVGLQLFFDQLLATPYSVSRAYTKFVGVLVGWIALTAVVYDWQQGKAEDHQENL